jgi:hypothetical protein
MDYLLFFSGLFVTCIALFKRELLVNRQSFQIILVFSLASFILAIALHFTEPGRRSSSGALLTPLISLGLYRFGRSIFVRRFNHEPRDTYMDWSPGMAADRVFNIVYFVVSFWLAMLTAIGMEELGNRGW